MSKIKHCLVCGKEYEYCSHCRDAGIQPWKALFDTEGCMNLKYAWDEHRNNMITDAEFKSKVEALGFSANDVTNTLIKKTIDEVNGAIVEETPAVAEEIETPVVEETKAESANNTGFFSKKNK